MSPGSEAMHINPVPAVRWLYEAYASEIGEDPYSPYARAVFMRNCGEALQKLREEKRILHWLSLASAGLGEGLVKITGAFYYAKAIARLIDKTQARQVREVIGPDLYAAIMRMSGAMRLPLHPLPQSMAEAVRLRGTAIIVGTPTHPLIIAALERAFGKHRVDARPEAALTESIIHYAHVSGLIPEAEHL